MVKYLIEYERITGEEFEKIFHNEPVELVSYKERKEALEKPDEEEKPEDESDDRTGDEPEQRHEGSGEDSPEDKPEKEAEQKFYRGPISSLMPNSMTMRRARSLACFRSPMAPVHMSSSAMLSATRPPILMAIWSSILPREMWLSSLSGMVMV